MKIITEVTKDGLFSLGEIEFMFFKDQLKVIQDSRNVKEAQFDKLQQERRIRVKQAYSEVDPKKRGEKFDDMRQFEEVRDKLMKLYEKIWLERRAVNDQIELEEGFNTELSQLMDKYIPLPRNHETQGQ